MHVVKTFPVYEANRVVVVGEALEGMVLVLPDTLVQIVRHADVECTSGSALHDVDVVAIFSAHCKPRVNARSLDYAFRSLRERNASLGMTWF